MRTVAPKETIRRVLPMLEAIGVTRVADVTGLDRVGIPNFTTVRPREPGFGISYYNDKGDRAYFRGCFVVTSANNFPVVSFPSLYSSVASVACNVATDPFEFHVNPDPPVEFLAPGIDIEVAWRGGVTMRATGNSFAAPHISGIAALICGKHPGLWPPEIKSVLLATAANVPMSRAAGLPGTLDSVPRDGVLARARSAIMPAVVPPHP